MDKNMPQRKLLHIQQKLLRTNKFYQRKSGIPLGSPFSPLQADIFISRFGEVTTSSGLTRLFLV